jgi:hypothetical protein
MQLADGDLIGVGPLTFQVAISANDSASVRETDEETILEDHEARGDSRARLSSSATPLPPTQLVPSRLRDAQEMLCM